MKPSIQLESVESGAQTRRKNLRFGFLQRADWDFFTAGSGSKSACIENISESGCLLRSDAPIEHRRWIRLIVKEASQNLWFTSVGRVIRREDKLEATPDGVVTLYRYGVEFIHPLNPLVMSRLQDSSSLCSECHKQMGNIPDINNLGAILCVRCHLRRSCQDLMIQGQDLPEGA